MNAIIANRDRLADVFICRHGQTDYNAEARLQGQQEVPINRLGHAQARRNGVYLKLRLGERAKEFRFLCSPLGRAQETMQIMRAEMGLAPEGYSVDDRLREVSFGDWESSTLKEVALRDPEGIARRKADKWNFRCPGEKGESYADLLARLKPLFDALLPQTIVVAHGGVSRAFLRAHCGLSEEDAAEEGIPQDRILTVKRGRANWV